MKVNAFFLLLCFFACFGCSPKESNTGHNHLLHIPMGEATRHERSVKLSEIADTILFLPLETSTEFIGNKYSVDFSGSVILLGSQVYDWNGKFIHEVGKKGQGPGEEVFLRKIVKTDTRYYSIADKLIAYDAQGMYAGYEKSNFDLGGMDLAKADTNLVIYTVDSLLFLNKRFDIVNARRVIEELSYRPMLFGSETRVFTGSNNSLFYNYINDSIYSITDRDLSVRWILDLKDLKIPDQYLIGKDLSILTEGSHYFMNGNFDNWDYLTNTDNKIRILAVYEAEKLLLIQWRRVYEFHELRNAPAPIPQIAYYNKETGKAVAVKGEGFTDDLEFLDTFYPQWGSHENYMITSYWPFELKEKAKEFESKGNKIRKQTKDILDKLKDDDNPVLVMVRLK